MKSSSNLTFAPFTPFGAWAAGLALAVLAQSAQALPTVQFDAAATSVQVGDSFDLVLRGSGFDTSLDGKPIANVNGGQKLNLAFTAGKLEITAVAIDPRWNLGFANLPGTIDNAAGTLTGLSFVTFPFTTDHAFDIARITFRAASATPLATPASVVVTSADLLGKVGGVASTTFAGNYVPTAVSISAVPEPETWALMLAGLGWVALRLRRA